MGKQKTQEIKKYGNLTFGEASRLLVDIIGQNVILHYISKSVKNEKDAKNSRNAYKEKLGEMYNGKGVYRKFSTTEEMSPQWFIEKYFENILEEKYGITHLAYVIVDSFTWQFFYALTWTTPFEIAQKETALSLIRKQLFNLISELLIGVEVEKYGLLKITKEYAISYLEDSFYKVFLEIEKVFTEKKKNIEPTNNLKTPRKLTGIEKLYRKSIKEKKTMHDKITSFFDANADKYPRLYSDKYSPEYNKNIGNWKKENNNPTWKTLEPILDFLKANDEHTLVHRLIGLYLLMNTQKAIKDVLHINEDEQEKIITDIKSMILENRNPAEFYTEVYNEYSEKDFYEQNILIQMALTYQNRYTEFDPIIFCGIIEAIKNKCSRSKIFFEPWLKARTIIFEKYDSLINDKNKQNEIIESYRKAYDKGIAYAGEYLSQFLLEAIVINNAFSPKQVKATNDYHGYGYALEIFGTYKQVMLDFLKKVKDTDPREDIVNLYFNIRLKKFGLEILSFATIHKEAISINNQGLEFEKSNNYTDAIKCFSKAIEMNPIYVNAYSNRGNVFNKMGELYTEKVLIDFNMALLLDPNHENTLFNRGMLFLETAQFKKAIIDFSKLIEIKPNDFETYTKRGICYAKMKNMELALLNYNMAIEINPSFKEAYINRGLIYKFLGDYDKANS